MKLKAAHIRTQEVLHQTTANLSTVLATLEDLQPIIDHAKEKAEQWSRDMAEGKTGNYLSEHGQYFPGVTGPKYGELFRFMSWLNDELRPYYSGESKSRSVS